MTEAQPGRGGPLGDQRQRCRSGKIFYQPQDSGEVLFILKKGRVQPYRLSPEGKKLVVATIGPGTIFGEMGILGQGMQNSFAEAVGTCRETATQPLNEFKARQLIDIGRKRIDILNPAGLEAAAAE